MLLSSRAYKTTPEFIKFLKVFRVPGSANWGLNLIELSILLQSCSHKTSVATHFFFFYNTLLKFFVFPQHYSYLICTNAKPEISIGFYQKYKANVSFRFLFPYLKPKIITLNHGFPVVLLQSGRFRFINFSIKLRCEHVINSINGTAYLIA